MQKNCWGYPVEFVEDVFGSSAVLAETLRAVTGAERPRFLIVADLNVVQRTEGLGSRIGRYVNANGLELAGSPVVLAGGEKVKADGFQGVFKVVSALLEARLGHADCVLAIGGGTILDVAGYAAAQVRGGVGLVRVPTTPAAMMDAAFAACAAVDSPTVKDALRVASTPAAVLIDRTFAQTVLDGVWRGGLGEAVRLTAVSDAAALKKLAKLAPAYRAREAGTLEEILDLVIAVRRKKGPTTFAEWAAARLESMSGYKLPHGYAIAIGICVDLAYAAARGFLSEKDAGFVRGILEECGALDGLAHSKHLLNQAGNVLCGLDAWALSDREGGIVLPAGLGKSVREPAPDRAVYEQVLRNFSAVVTTP